MTMATPSEAPRSDVPSFATTLGPLAHHFFPDGCPEASLEAIWPVRIERAPVSARQAQQALELELPQWVQQQGGLTDQEMEIVALIAVAMLPAPLPRPSLSRTINTTTTTSAASLVRSGSPLVHGRHFRALIQSCLIPRRGYRISVAVLDRLWIAALRLSGDGQDDDETNAGKCTMACFLALAGMRPDALQLPARRYLESSEDWYSLLLSWALRPATCRDAVRLLVQLTTSPLQARVHRAQRLRRCVEEAMRAPSSKRFGSSQPQPHEEQQVCILLLDRLAELNPQGCGPYCLGLPRVPASLLDFPHTGWMHRFLHGGLPLNEEMGERSQARPHKRPCLPPTDPVGAWMPTLQSRVAGIDGPSAEPWKVDSNWSLTHLLHHAGLRLVIMLSAGSKDDEMGHDDDAAWLRSKFTLTVEEEWNRAFDLPTPTFSQVRHPPARTALGPNKTRRRDILSSLASFAAQTTHSLWPEAEVFLIRHVLSSWDGQDPLGYQICLELLPYFSPCSFSSLRTRVLSQVEKWILGGTDRLQYVMIAGYLSSLLYRWSRLPWDASKFSNPDRAKRRTVCEIIQWTDDVALRVLATPRGDALLFRLAATDFFQTVNHISSYLDTLVLPSAWIPYRLLLSNCVVPMDLVCELLLEYKASYRRMKERLQQGRLTHDHALTGLDRIPVFNCLVWDFCSVLWQCQPPPPPSFSKPSTRALSILFTDLRPEVQSKLYDNPNFMENVLGITHDAAFASMAHSFLHTIQAPASRMTLPDWTLENRMQYVDYLSSTWELRGLQSFVSTFVKNTP